MVSLTVKTTHLSTFPRPKKAHLFNDQAYCKGGSPPSLTVSNCKNFTQKKLSIIYIDMWQYLFKVTRTNFVKKKTTPKHTVQCKPRRHRLCIWHCRGGHSQQLQANSHTVATSQSYSCSNPPSGLCPNVMKKQCQNR